MMFDVPDDLVPVVIEALEHLQEDNEGWIGSHNRQAIKEDPKLRRLQQLIDLFNQTS